jgi:starch phosphorylase
LTQKKPVQLIFSGKAHPQDEPGKHFLRQVFEICASHEFGGQVAFIENYDKEVAHHLLAGVDVWLNNPIPPLEASGTSGEKASLNGVPNLSVLDGWWCEGYNGSNGWAIEGNNDQEAAASLYHLLEQEIIPTYYRNDFNGVPRKWVGLMKEAICSTAATFSARRMVKDYLEKIYLG